MMVYLVERWARCMQWARCLQSEIIPTLPESSSISNVKYDNHVWSYMIVSGRWLIWQDWPLGPHDSMELTYLLVCLQRKWAEFQLIYSGDSRAGEWRSKLLCRCMQWARCLLSWLSRVEKQASLQVHAMGVGHHDGLSCREVGQMHAMGEVSTIWDYSNFTWIQFYF